MDDEKQILCKGSRGGFCNRLMILAANSVLCRYNNALLVTSWPNNSSCPADFVELFDLPRITIVKKPNSVQWNITSDGWNVVDYWKRNKSLLQNSLPEFIQDVYSEVRRLKTSLKIPLFVADFQNKVPIRNLIGIHWRGTDSFAHKKWLARSRFAGDLTMEFRMVGILQRMLYLLMPIHVLKRMQMRRLHHDIRREIEIGKKEFFISSDNVQDRESIAEFVERNGGNIYFLPLEKVDSPLRKTSIQSAIADLVMLSECRGILASDFLSTFTFVASILGSVPVINGKLKYPTELVRASLARSG